MKKRMSINKSRWIAAVAAGVLLLGNSGCGYLGNREHAFVSREDSDIVITVLAGQSTTDAGVEDMINEVILEKFPEIELEWECVDWGNEFGSKLQGRIASGDMPDLIIGKVQDVIYYAKSGILESISIEDPSRLDANVLKTITYEGKMYGVPYNALYQGVLYNKRIFQEYDLQVPATRQELIALAEQLQKLGIVPFAAHFQESWNVGNLTMQFLIGDVFQKDPTWGDRFRKGEVNFSKNALLEETFLQNRFLLEHSFEDALMIDQYECDKRFAEGKAAMYLTGTWSLQAIEQYAEDKNEYGIFPYPNADGDAKLIKETNMTFMMGKGSKNKEYVESILEELLSNEVLMQEILDFTQTYPVVEGVDISYESCIYEEVNRYETSGRVVDAAAGNGQLTWSYQIPLAEETLRWLKDENELYKVFSYADEKRSDS